MGDKESSDVSSILKRKGSDPKVLEERHSSCRPTTDPTTQKPDEDPSDQGEGAGPRRQSVTFTSSSNEPCLDRRKLQRTPTPFHEILMAEAEKCPETLTESATEVGDVSFQVGESPTVAASTAIRPSKREI